MQIRLTQTCSNVWRTSGAHAGRREIYRALLLSLASYRQRLGKSFSFVTSTPFYCRYILPNNNTSVNTVRPVLLSTQDAFQTLSTSVVSIEQTTTMVETHFYHWKKLSFISAFHNKTNKHIFHFYHRPHNNEHRSYCR